MAWFLSVDVFGPVFSRFSSGAHTFVSFIKIGEPLSFVSVQYLGIVIWITHREREREFCIINSMHLETIQGHIVGTVFRIIDVWKYYVSTANISQWYMALTEQVCTGEVMTKYGTVHLHKHFINKLLSIEFQ